MCVCRPVDGQDQLTWPTGWVLCCSLSSPSACSWSFQGRQSFQSAKQPFLGQRLLHHWFQPSCFPQLQINFTAYCSKLVLAWPTQLVIFFVSVSWVEGKLGTGVFPSHQTFGWLCQKVLAAILILPSKCLPAWPLCVFLCSQPERP